MQPQYKGSIMGTMVFTLTAIDENEMTGPSEFDVLRIILELQRAGGFLPKPNEIILAIKVDR